MTLDYEKKASIDLEALRPDLVKISEKRIPSSRRREGYVPRFPARLLAVILEKKAEKAFPLVLAIHRQLHMSGKGSTPIGGAIWDLLGRPSRKQKTAMLKKLRTLRGIVRLTAKQTTFSFYRASKGPLWDQADQE